MLKIPQCLQVEIYSSFRPGDLVRAQVVSLGDSRSYFLSTARNDCGVVYAKSTSGELLQPIEFPNVSCIVCLLYAQSLQYGATCEACLSFLGFSRQLLGIGRLLWILLLHIQEVYTYADST